MLFLNILRAAERCAPKQKRLNEDCLQDLYGYKKHLLTKPFITFESPRV